MIAHEFLVMLRHIICVTCDTYILTFSFMSFENNDQDAFLGLQIAHLRLSNIQETD